MNIRTNYLLGVLLRRAWIAVLAGLVLAGGFYLFRGRAAAPAEQAPSAAAEPAAAADPTADPRLNRFALYTPDFSGYAEQEQPIGGINEYAASISAFVAARFQTDAAYWGYYDAVFQAYPQLDASVFTSDTMRAMIAVWQYNYDVVLRVSSPVLDAAQLSHCAEAMGLSEDDAAVQCRLRDTVFQAVCAAMDDPERLADAGIALRRTDVSYEEMMAQQSLVVAQGEENLFAVKEGLLAGDEAESGPRPVGRKALLLVFALGFLLVEAAAALCVLFDPRVKNAADFRLNTDLPLLQEAAGPGAELTEAALRLGGRAAPVILAVGVDACAAQALSSGLSDARKTVLGSDEKPAAPVLFERETLDWLVGLRDRPVLVAVQPMKTTYDDLKLAADGLAITKNEIYGAVLFTPDLKGKAKKG